MGAFSSRLIWRLHVQCHISTTTPCSPPGTSCRASTQRAGVTLPWLVQHVCISFLVQTPTKGQWGECDAISCMATVKYVTWINWQMCYEMYTYSHSWSRATSVVKAEQKCSALFQHEYRLWTWLWGLSTSSSAPHASENCYYILLQKCFSCTENGMACFRFFQAGKQAMVTHKHIKDCWECCPL